MGGISDRKRSRQTRVVRMVVNLTFGLSLHVSVKALLGDVVRLFGCVHMLPSLSYLIYLFIECDAFYIGETSNSPFTGLNYNYAFIKYYFLISSILNPTNPVSLMLKYAN